MVTGLAEVVAAQQSLRLHRARLAGPAVQTVEAAAEAVAELRAHRALVERVALAVLAPERALLERSLAEVLEGA